MDSKIGLIIQLSGVCLITLLTLFLRRSIKVVALRYWTNAWCFLCFALFSLRLAFSFDDYSAQLFGLYFLTEYFFGLLLVAGCRTLADNQPLRSRQELFVIPFIVVAFGLPFVSDDFFTILNVHAVILSGFFAMGFIELWRVHLRTFGSRVMLIALGLLTLDYVQYFAVLTARQYIDFSTAYLSYNAVVDLGLQMLLGFGMVIVLLERVLADAKDAHAELKKAHEKLEAIAHIDPLTTALTRHAFQGYIKDRSGEDAPVTGCVGFFDIDDLKELNDVFGHAAGDIVIRAVVRAIRASIRAEDLIFRWGGDEFFVLMVGLDADLAVSRMTKLDLSLTNIKLDEFHQPLTIRVSHAFENFSGLSDLEPAINKADAKMYIEKQNRKRTAIDPFAVTMSSKKVAEPV